MMRAVFIVLLFSAGFFKVNSMTVKDMLALIHQGQNHLIGETEKVDSAIVCFSRLVNSYDAGLTKKQKYYCAIAAVNLSSIYFQYVGDYKSAYKSLVRASEISDEVDNPVIATQIATNFADIYAIFAQQANSPEFAELSVEEYKKAFKIASENESWLQAIVIFCNFTSEIHKPGYIEQFADEIRLFDSLPVPSDIPDSGYAGIRQKSALALLEKDTVKAINYLKLQLTSDYDTPNKPVYTHQNLRALSYLYCQRHRLDSARYYAKTLLMFGQKFNDQEAVSDAYYQMEQIYKEEGNADAAKDMHVKFLIIQDSILNVQNLGTINNLKFINDLALERRQAAVMLTEAGRQKKSRERIIFSVGLILVITVVILIVTVKRHQRLQVSYRDLYNRQQLKLEREDTNRKLRESNMEQGAINASEHSDSMRILAILDKSAEIFDLDFSLDRLSELTDIRPRTLSAILNEQLHTTFRDLINKYRVREACKRLNDTENFGQYTIEAISQSVGYKSRTSLITAFKKETGLTPSEYKRMVRHKNI